MVETLFRVYVINPYNGEVVISGEMVMAENERDAVRKVSVERLAYDISVQLEELLVYVNEVDKQGLPDA